MIDIFKITTPAVKRKFVQTVELRQVLFTVPHTQTFNLSSMPFLGLAIFQPTA